MYGSSPFYITCFLHSTPQSGFCSPWHGKPFPIGLSLLASLQGLFPKNALLAFPKLDCPGVALVTRPFPPKQGGSKVKLAEGVTDTAKLPYGACACSLTFTHFPPSLSSSLHVSSFLSSHVARATSPSSSLSLNWTWLCRPAVPALSRLRKDNRC